MNIKWDDIFLSKLQGIQLILQIFQEHSHVQIHRWLDSLCRQNILMADWVEQIYSSLFRCFMLLDLLSIPYFILQCLVKLYSQKLFLKNEHLLFCESLNIQLSFPFPCLLPLFLLYLFHFFWTDINGREPATKPSTCAGCLYEI